MRLNQEEQIILLKSGVFELAVLAMVPRYNCEMQTLTVDSMILPAHVFVCEDSLERQFIADVHACLHELAQFRYVHSPV